jgi:hypothetical protein
VCGVGHEPALAGEGPVEAGQHVIEGVCQFLELVVGPVEADALAEMLLRGSPGGSGERVEREQDPPSRRPPQDAGHDRGDAQAGEGPQQQYVKVAGALAGGPEAEDGLLASGLLGGVYNWGVADFCAWHC